MTCFVPARLSGLSGSSVNGTPQRGEARGAAFAVGGGAPDHHREADPPPASTPRRRRARPRRAGLPQRDGVRVVGRGLDLDEPPPLSGRARAPGAGTDPPRRAPAAAVGDFQSSVRASGARATWLRRSERASCAPARSSRRARVSASRRLHRVRAPSRARVGVDLRSDPRSRARRSRPSRRRQLRRSRRDGAARAVDRSRSAPITIASTARSTLASARAAVCATMAAPGAPMRAHWPGRARCARPCLSRAKRPAGRERPRGGRARERRRVTIRAIICLTMALRAGERGSRDVPSAWRLPARSDHARPGHGVCRRDIPLCADNERVGHRPDRPCVHTHARGSSTRRRPGLRRTAIPPGTSPFARIDRATPGLRGRRSCGEALAGVLGEAPRESARRRWHRRAAGPSRARAVRVRAPPISCHRMAPSSTRTARPVLHRLNGRGRCFDRARALPTARRRPWRTIVRGRARPLRWWWMGAPMAGGERRRMPQRRPRPVRGDAVNARRPTPSRARGSARGGGARAGAAARTGRGAAR